MPRPARGLIGGALIRFVVGAVAVVAAVAVYATNYSHLTAGTIPLMHLAHDWGWTYDDVPDLAGATSVAIDRKRARFALSSRVSLIASSFERAIKDSTIGRLTPGVSASGGARRPSAANAGADDASPDHAVVAAFRVTASAALTASSTRISWR